MLVLTDEDHKLRHSVGTADTEFITNDDETVEPFTTGQFQPRQLSSTLIPQAGGIPQTRLQQVREQAYCVKEESEKNQKAAGDNYQEDLSIFEVDRGSLENHQGW